MLSWFFAWILVLTCSFAGRRSLTAQINTFIHILIWFVSQKRLSTVLIVIGGIVTSILNGVLTLGEMSWGRSCSTFMTLGHVFCSTSTLFHFYLVPLLLWSGGETHKNLQSHRLFRIICMWPPTILAGWQWLLGCCHMCFVGICSLVL